MLLDIMQMKSMKPQCPLGHNNFLYELWNGPIIYDALVKNLVLVR